MRWKSFRYSEKSFLFTGICAETIRGYPNQNQKDYTEKWRNLSKSYGTEFEIPTKKIIDSSFSKLKEDFPQIDLKVLKIGIMMNLKKKIFIIIIKNIIYI